MGSRPSSMPSTQGLWDEGNVLVVFGSRSIRPSHQLLDALSYTHDVGFDLIISGGAKGVDTVAEEWAASKDKAFECYPADWEKHGRVAGMIRNRFMADRATHGICVWDGTSRGTKDMLEVMEERGKPVAAYIARL